MSLLDQRFDFSGAKIALFCEGKVLSSLRDDFPNLPYAGYWDLPGGGREDNETPFECLQREVEEELSLTLTKDHVDWVKTYQGMLDPEKLSVFMVGHISRKEYDSIILGDEGQDYKLMSVDEFLIHEKVIPQLQDRLKDYLEERVYE
ncbi:NUDIX hydrolase [Streptococcus saliviloxodontae]|uniref:8-oxo-dGTP diphosphatase n=1 Tax=Streptococcus saliviloxodontae TaxID=1349416 RepID=A0ABS2PNL7_9STRE|nr:NUDIX hydrolase [Streptococcus saliviloxodontae]MBM7636887.1 8-oxo-dGTP diphosphatase [Streptococcus saliviloxodontae]